MTKETLINELNQACEIVGSKYQVAMAIGCSRQALNKYVQFLKRNTLPPYRDRGKVTSDKIRDICDNPQKYEHLYVRSRVGRKVKNDN